MSSSLPIEPRRYLIAIGSSQCPKMNFPDLTHIKEDIRQVTTLFKAQGYKPVLSEQIDLDDTSQRIKEAISSWFASSERRPSDCVIVYYGGHGDEGGRFGHHYLFTLESTEHRIGGTAIKTKDFVESFFCGCQDTSPQNVLLILDTCYAHVGGRQISEVLSELKGATPEGSGFWVICSSDSNTEAGDGAFVEALCAVMHPDREEFQQDREFIPIETLVSRINNHFKTTQQAQRAIADGRGVKEKTTFFRNPRYIKPNQIFSQPMSGQKNWRLSLIDCLWSLDCRPQTRVFEDCTRTIRVAAFVVQARDTRIQYWLVKRLFNQLPNVRNARVFPFVIPAHPLWKQRDFNELWHDFAKQLKCAAEATIILDKLVEIYQTKPVIMAMYGWQESRRSQQLQIKVLTDFWQPLVQKVRGLANQPSRSRLVLFLAAGSTEEPEVGDDVTVPIRLAPLTEIFRDDVAYWLDSQQVSPILQQVVQREDAINSLIEQDIEDWDADPVQTLQQICYVFGLENGIADIESEWRLMG